MRVGDAVRALLHKALYITKKRTMYVDPNYPSKKAFKAAVLAGEIHEPYNPSGMFSPARNGRMVIEGPHLPQASSMVCGGGGG